MRKVIAGLFISLDGVAEAPDQWQFDFDEEMGAAMSRILDGQDVALLGRVTYAEWADYWPTATDPFADYLNKITKYVASTTLESVEWENSTLITGSVADFVRELREQDGGTIGTAGSPGLVRYLLGEGLIDELVLLIHPVIAGGNRKRLFADDAELAKLKLISATPTSSGVIVATYEPVR
jgi:dihydrofolate reductase